MNYLKLSASSLNSFQLCPRHFYYEKRLNLITAEPSEALEKGDLMHKMLASYYQSFIDDKAKSQKDRVEEAVILGYNHAASLAVDPEETMFQFREYCKFYEGENIEPLAVEQTFCEQVAVINDLTILFEGIIDLIYVTHPQRVKIVCDHKTVSRDSVLTPMNNQFMGYSWYTGIPTVVKNQIGYQKTLSPEKRFVRKSMSYEEPVIKEWVTNVVHYAQMIMGHLESDFFPQNLTSCDKYGLCRYEKLCVSIPEAREFKMKMEFRVREDPDEAHT